MPTDQGNSFEGAPRRSVAPAPSSVEGQPVMRVPLREEFDLPSHAAGCEFGDHGDEHPCGRQVVDGVTTCHVCGHLDGSVECQCWIPATQAHVDVLVTEAMERRLL